MSAGLWFIKDDVEIYAIVGRVDENVTLSGVTAIFTPKGRQLQKRGQIEGIDKPRTTRLCIDAHERAFRFGQKHQARGAATGLKVIRATLGADLNAVTAHHRLSANHTGVGTRCAARPPQFAA